MLHPKPFAHAAALLTGIVYLLFYVLGAFVPVAMVFLFNAQFLGANVARMIPTDVSFVFFLGNLVAMVVMTWVFAYLFAWLYNRFAK